MAKIPAFDFDEKSLTASLRNAFRDLGQILLNLSPTDNFKGFLWSGTIAVSTETKIPHKLNVVPSGYIITYNQGGTIQAGDALWTNEFVYLKNSGAATAIGKVYFFV